MEIALQSVLCIAVLCLSSWAAQLRVEAVLPPAGWSALPSNPCADCFLGFIPGRRNDRRPDSNMSFKVTVSFQISWFWALWSPCTFWCLMAALDSPCRFGSSRFGHRNVQWRCSSSTSNRVWLYPLLQPEIWEHLQGVLHLAGFIARYLPLFWAWNGKKLRILEDVLFATLDPAWYFCESMPCQLCGVSVLDCRHSVKQCVF